MQKWLLAALLGAVGLNGISQTTLTPGDIAVIGFNTDDPDQIMWVTLVDLAAGTQVKFTDNCWNGTALTTTEGTTTWTASAAVPRGTVQSLTISGISLGTTGDQVMVYQGAATSPSFIFGLSTNNWVTGTISLTTSRRPSTLTAGTTAIAFSTERDNGYYTTASNTGDKTSFLTAIGNTANWTRSDNRYASFPAWTFTFAGLSPEPTSNPTNLTFSSLKSYQYSVNFTAASPAPTGYLMVRATGGLPNTDPVDGVEYTQGSILGNGVVLSSSSALTFLDRSVVAATTYGIKVYAYAGNGTLRNYRQTSPLAGTVVSNANEIGTYYQTVSPNNATFVTDLQNRIRSPYTKVSYDLYDETMLTNFAFGYAPNNQRTVTCVYSGQVYAYTPPFVWYTASPFSREHTWCVSWMPSGGGTTLNEYADQHHLFPVNQNSANGVRSNHPLGVVQTVTSSYLEGKYGLDASGNTVYEPRNAQKGDAARAMLYMSLR
ncbi:MAG: endonuclease, partial [Flavobacteriales bacterium]